MKVVLPDNSELELPDGATGLDAARAIGPKLAEQAVLVRSNGAVAGPARCRSHDGAADPDPDHARHRRPGRALRAAPLGAHLLAEAVRRLYPGVKIAIGPPIENGFYYDFEFPEPITEADLERIEDEVRRELEEGREWAREEISRDEARAALRGRGRAVQGRARRHRRGRHLALHAKGDFTDLCRGPHLQNSKPIKAFKLTGLAGAYWRGDEQNKQLTRIYGTAFYSQADLDAYLERLEEARKRDHRRLGVAARPLPLRGASRRARRSGTRRGW